MMSLLKSIFIRRWPFGCLLVFCASCSQEDNYNKLTLTGADSLKINKKKFEAREMIHQARSVIAHGDMIVRTGNDFTSESLRQFSTKDKTYSHCGIASVENDSIFVYHALGGEWNPDQKLRRDPLELFCRPEENRGFGIFNFNFTPQQLANLDSIVHKWHSEGRMFDMQFSLSTDDRLYCAEFVAKAISAATMGSIQFETTQIDAFKFFAVDNLLLNSHCKEKKRYRF
jgi:hypothetical protein